MLYTNVSLDVVCFIFHVNKYSHSFKIKKVITQTIKYTALTFSTTNP